jgi:hypothetical protein
VEGQTVDDMFSASFLKKIRSFCLDDGVARGGDHPSSKEDWRTMSRRQPCLVLFSHEEWSHAVLGGRGTSDWPSARYFFNYYSQNPKLTLDFGNVEYEIGVESMEVNEATGSAAQWADIEIDDVSEQQVREILRQLQVANVKDEQVTKIGTAAKPTGLDSFSIQLKSQVFGRRVDKSQEYVKDKNILDGMMDTKGLRIALITPRYLETNFRYRFWKGRLDACTQSGIYPVYQKIISEDQHGERFTSKKSWMVIERQPWMKMEDDSEVEASYASHDPILRFSSFKEYEIVQKMAVLLEYDFRITIINKTFNHGNPHWVEICNDNGYITFTLEITRSEDSVKSFIQVGSKFTARRHDPLNVAESVMEVDGAKVPITVTGHDGQWDCHVLDGFPGPWDCTMSVNIEPGQEKDWENGKRMLLTLVMDINTVPRNRQLAAIGAVARLPEDSSLTRILLASDYNGRKVKPKQSLVDERSLLASQLQLQWAASYYNGSGLNKEQREAFGNTFNNATGIAMLQGPPGTGKTSTCAMIAVSAAVTGIPVLVTAPSDTATRELARKIAWEVGRLPSAAKESFKWMYFPTMSETKDNLLTVHTMRNDGSDGGSSFIEARFHQHILRLVYQKARGNGTDRGEAQQWLVNREIVMNGGTLDKKQGKRFAELTWDYGQEVFRDDQLKIVVSTCNNSAHEAQLLFEAWLVIIDEAAFALECECLVPLKQDPKMILLAGDHEQLSPIVTSARDNEYGGQLAMSLFERVLELAVPFTCLKLNYRMAPAISDLVGVLKYNGLQCAQCTLGHGLVYRAWEAFWEDSSNARLRQMRRLPLNKAQDANPCIRRLFFNINGRSGPQKGSSSLQNFANINTIMKLYREFCAFNPGGGVPAIDSKKITIQVPYSAQKNEMIRQLELRLPNESFTVKTIDSNQGGRSEMVILDLTPANAHHGSAVGFLRGWNRMNVGLSRASEVLVIIGNLDRWMTEIEVFPQAWALFLIDLLERGDVIDLHGDWNPNHSLPANNGEVITGAWTNESPPSEPVNNKGLGIMSKSTEKSRAKYMDGLVDKLYELRRKAGASTNSSEDRELVEAAPMEAATSAEETAPADDRKYSDLELDIYADLNLEDGEVQEESRGELRQESRDEEMLDEDEQIRRRMADTDL